MTTQDEPRGSREAYERLSDPAMYWTQVNAQPIREPIRREPPRDEERDQYHELPDNHPYRELSPDWQADADPEETRLAELLPYDEQPVYDDRRAEAHPPETSRAERPARTHYDDEEIDEAHEQFGGVNWGAGFFGWLVAVSFTLFLSAVLGVVFTVLRRLVPTVSSLADRPGAAAVALAAGGALALMLGYYAGGYVAGRMSRFDGGRQGAGVWVTGLLMTAVILGFSLFLGSEYSLASKVDLPSLPLPGASLGLAGLVGVVAALLGSMLMAIWGGKVGCRYHQKVDDYL